jgi:hypothetical protein
VTIELSVFFAIVFEVSHSLCDGGQVSGGWLGVVGYDKIDREFMKVVKES